jgi:arabinan endo-1,5-alpha-L-arabinosidase
MNFSTIFNGARFILVIMVGILAGACQSENITDQVVKVEEKSSFINPVLDRNFPDPTVIRGRDGVFYAYGTNNTTSDSQTNIQLAKSEDLITWEYLGDAMPQGPDWADKDFWAPHVQYEAKSETYFLYYSGESTDQDVGKCLGVATSKSPLGPFVDKGEPLLCGKEFINIDPMSLTENGERYYFWGSAFEPIKLKKLTSDGLSFTDQAAPEIMISVGEDLDYSNLIEGAWVHKKNDYYYLFYSGDNCCGDGANYAVMVARSHHLAGPYERYGENHQNGSSVILAKNDRWLAPGHNSIITDDAGDDWIFYHAIDLKNKSKGRVMLMDKIIYVDGWPSIKGASPSIGQEDGPVIEE